jgi:hypothetical protein
LKNPEPQTQNQKRFGHLKLEFETCLGFGACDLGFAVIGLPTP